MKPTAAGGAGAALVVLADDASVALVEVIGGHGNISAVLDVLQADIAANSKVLGIALAGVVVAITRAGWRRIRNSIDLDRDGRSDLDQVDTPIDGPDLTRRQARTLRG